MTDFVINKRKELLRHSEYKNDLENYANIIYNYAQFLKQHLTLGMFVPCDEDENVLEYPTCNWCSTGIPGDCHRSKECAIDETPFYNYNKAIEKIIFKNYVFLEEDDNYWYFMNNHKKIEILKNTCIERLINEGYDTELTENTIKKIGL